MSMKDKLKFGNDRDASKDLDRPVNLYVHQRDKKGSVAVTSPYRLVIENGQQMYEVPPGSGKFYSQNGHLVHEAEDSKQESKGSGKGFDSGAPMSQPVGAPKAGSLGEIKERPEQLQAQDDHVSQVRAQQELNQQQGKHAEASPQQAPQTKGSFTSKSDEGKKK